MKAVLQQSALTPEMRFRVQIKHAVAIGPGKAAVLELIRETGSIAEAGRRLGMGYQTVWALVRAMNTHFVAPLVSARRGGAAGGGARLTPTGERVLALYRAIERDAETAVARRLPELVALIRADAGAPPADAAGADGAPAPDAGRQRTGHRGSHLSR